MTGQSPAAVNAIFAAHKTGLWRSGDGGTTWKPVPVPQSGKWLHIEVWVHAPDRAAADRLCDAVADAAHDNEPAGCDVVVEANYASRRPGWAQPEDGES